MWPFRRRPFLSAAKADWIADHFDWVTETFGADLIPSRRLILPTREFFASGRGTDHATAEAVFAEVAAHLGIEDPIDLVPQFSLPSEWSHRYDTLTSVGGTFQRAGQGAIVSYDPALLHRPVGFIATMAHELMHYRLAPFVDDLPGGIETHEPATDLHCILWGFGVFQLQHAADAGWAGYLDQDSRAWALAQVLALTGEDPGRALAHLGPRPASRLRAALKDLGAV